MAKKKRTGNGNRPSLLAGADTECTARRSAIFRVFGLQRRASHPPADGWFPLKRDITPEMADALVSIHEAAVGVLGKIHPIQRRLIEHAIQRYARDMRNGRWGTGGAAMLWSVAGLCMNGQQRLYACARSRVTLKEMSIELDHDPDAILNSDQNVTKSPLGSIKCTGRLPAAKPQHATVAKMMEGIGGKQPTGSAKHTITELFDRITLHWQVIDFAVASLNGRKEAGLTVAAVVAAVAKAAYHESDLARLARFLPLLTGQIDPDDAGDRTVVSYAGHLIRRPRSGTGQERQQLHLKTQHTVACYMRGESRRSFRNIKDEVYPLPDGVEILAKGA